MSDAVHPPIPQAAATWRRFTPSQQALRTMVLFVLVAAVVQSIRSVQVIPEFLSDAPEQMGDMLARMWPIDWAHYPTAIHSALLETLHTATLGTVLSLALAVPFGVLVTPNLVPSRIVNFLARVVLVASRSVNSLVWALLFVAIFGPGPLAGMLAIALRSVGFVGKLVGEALEQAPRAPIEALQAAGASWSAQLWYGYWPHVRPAFSSVVLLRWDINVRESGVLGLVGAGGIGMVLDTALNLFQWSRVAAVLVTVFAVVVLAEVLVTRLRSKLL
jgi:phosphonate transport system permease protein